MRVFTPKKVALLGVLTALSVITFMVESLFPPLIIPGAKLGLGNIFVMLALCLLDLPSAIVMVVAKSLISAIFGGFSAIMYSLPAGLISVVLAYILLKQSKNFSIVAVSASVATVHNIVQNLVYVLIIQSFDVLIYAPYLAVIGGVSGVLTGIATFYIIRHFAPFVIKKISLNSIKEN